VGVPPLASITDRSADEVTVVGRVCCESEGKLNAQSVFLEGSRARSNACRTRLDLSECAEYALFPGQTVGVCGVNSMGHSLMARRIIPGLLPPPPTKPAPAAPASFLVATGPFTCSDELSYAPLDALLAAATQRGVDAVLLLGPFVDESHEQLAELHVTFDELFQQVLDKLNAFIVEQLDAHDRAPHLVLVPALRDVHHRPVFPQPPFAGALLDDAARPYVHFAPNPASVVVGGFRIGCSSLDSLMLLTQQEIARSAPPKEGEARPDRLSRLAAHVLKQRLYMPLCPPAEVSGAPLPVDAVANFERGTVGPRPDVLLLPSDLAPFAKVVEGGVVALNAGRLTRKQAGGSYAYVAVHKAAEDEAAAAADSDDPLAPAPARGVAARTYVEVVRI